MSALLVPGPGQASAPVTSLTMSFTLASGQPMAGAHVDVFAVPDSLPKDGASSSLPLIASSTANASGQITKLALNASAFDPASINGLGETNTVVFAQTPSGMTSMRWEVVKVGGATRDATPAVAGTNRATIQAGASPEPVSAVTTVTGWTHRYIKPIVFNAANGMTSNFHFSRSKSSELETQITVPLSEPGSGWTVGGFAKESSTYTAEADYGRLADFHRTVWAGYGFNREQTRYCGRYGCSTTTSWVPDGWTGQLVDSNPDRDKQGRIIGVEKYNVPPLDTRPADEVQLHPKGHGTWHWGRSTNQVAELGSQFSAAGFLTISAKVSFATGTSVNYVYKPGCTRRARVIWGKGLPPTTAGIVQASCTNDGARIP